MRTFDFRETDGVANANLRETDEPLQTTVTLRGFRKTYQAKFPKKAKTVAEKILEHCLAYFILGSAPEILIEDPTESEIFRLSESAPTETLRPVLILSSTKDQQLSQIRIIFLTLPSQ